MKINLIVDAIIEINAVILNDLLDKINHWTSVKIKIKIIIIIIQQANPGLSTWGSGILTFLYYSLSIPSVS